MGLTQALSSALSGLQANQASISMVAANVANADTPGYTRKIVNQVATGANTSIGVRVSDIQREIDLYVQRQLRTENAGASYADTRADVFAIAGNLRTARISYRAGIRVQQLHISAADAFYQPGRSRRTDGGHQQCAIVDPAAQSVERKHTGATRQCRTRHFRFGEQGQ